MVAGIGYAYLSHRVNVMSHFRALLIALVLVVLSAPVILRGVPAASADSDNFHGNGNGHAKQALQVRSTSYFDTKQRVEDDRANNQASRYSTRTTSNLVNHGGPVMSGNAVNVYLIYWAWGNTTAEQTSQAYVNGFFNAANGKAWLASTTQYSNASNAYVLHSVSDSSAIPAHPTQQDTANEAAKYAANLGPNNLYIVLTPHGHSESGFATQWCGYHSYATYSNGTWFAFASVPYQPDAGNSCGGLTYGDINSGYSIVGGHELAEAITDVQLNAWYDRFGAENGDKCAWVNIISNPAAGNYKTQPLWSNAKSGCVQTYP